MKNLLSITQKKLVLSLTAFFFVTACASINAHANNNQSNGTIHFSGAIVFPPCLNEVNKQHVILNCLNSETDMVANKLDLNNIANTEGWQVINEGRSEYLYNWINQEKQMGMLTIKYI